MFLACACGKWVKPHTTTQLREPRDIPVELTKFIKLSEFGLKLSFVGKMNFREETMTISEEAIPLPTGEFNNSCAQGLVLGNVVPTDCSINATIAGKTYCFSSEQARADFLRDSVGNLAKALKFAEGIPLIQFAEGGPQRKPTDVA